MTEPEKADPANPPNRDLLAVWQRWWAGLDGIYAVIRPRHAPTSSS